MIIYHFNAVPVISLIPKFVSTRGLALEVSSDCPSFSRTYKIIQNEETYKYLLFIVTTIK